MTGGSNGSLGTYYYGVVGESTRLAATVKRIEGVDHYDVGTNFNPFAVFDKETGPRESVGGSR